MATYKIAELLVKMETFGRTLAQAEPYRVADCGQVDIVIRSKPEALQKNHPHLSLDDCEYLLTGGSFYTGLIHFQGILLHSSCVVVDNRAYCFTAPCGTGKSTHVRLWLELFGPRAYILNDDKPALRVIDGEIFVFGTPWSGKNDCSRNCRVPFGGIAMVRRAGENAITQMNPDAAFFTLLDQTVRSGAEQNMNACINTAGKLVETGKIFELFCNMDISAARLSYETMSGKRFEP